MIRLPHFESSNRGQAMIESFFIAMLITIITFAALQLCIIAVDDLICNEAAFTAMRTGIVSSDGEIDNVIKSIVNYLLLPHCLGLNNIILDAPRYWNSEPLDRSMYDHRGCQIKKYNTNIPYRIRIMFGSLLKPIGFGGGAPFIEQTARARMIKSPDREFYYRSYPGARCFTANRDSNE